MREFTTTQFLRNLDSIKEFLASVPSDSFCFIGAQTVLTSNGSPINDKFGEQVGIWDAVVTIKENTFLVEGAPGPSCPFGLISATYELSNANYLSDTMNANKDEAPADVFENLEELKKIENRHWAIEYFYVDGDDHLEQKFLSAISK